MKNTLAQIGLGLIVSIALVSLCGLFMWIIKDNRALEILCCSVVSFWIGIIYSSLDNDIFN